MAPFVVRDIPRFRGALRVEAEARRLLLRRLLLLDAERLFLRADAPRRLLAERFLDERLGDLERLRDADLFLDAIRFLLVRTYGDGARRTVGNCVA